MYLNAIKDNLYQIYAITEKEIKLSLRYKIPLILSFISPLLSIMLPIIVMGQLYTFSGTFGPWNSENFFVFQLTAYQISLLWTIIFKFPSKLNSEKYWQTLSALIIAPFNKFNLLLGILFSHWIIELIPITIFFIVGYIYYPISLLTLLFIIAIYFLISLIFSGVGLIIGVFIISKEGLVSIITLGLTVLVIFSCISLPFEFFPDYFQQFTVLNPLYYIYNFPRLVWIEDNIFYSLITHPIHSSIIFSTTVIFPTIGIIIFNYIYKKYGITGY